MTHLQEAVLLIIGAAGAFGQELTRQLFKAGSRLILSDLEEVIIRKRAEVIWPEVGTGDVIPCLGTDLSSREGSQSLTPNT
ncbi:hypothetical protein BJP34_09600 [Moorena producens PAL-8-15-08-1]|uniref:Polysaccharide biosynthesis protein CapD-like domain-containing protein n=1 Tax=Moorena producens PAL-8-15-08-1 TaxID=1458985 RepID=A0A1D8TPV4_9CYAN|nr:hypothetical protein [Moorena producens]AOW99677.1 hypothetical protein BJP34_09600 [Moorena producens PAL-8-15-08-1]